MRTWLVPFLLGAPALLLSMEVLADGGEAAYTERGCIYCHGPAGKQPALPVYPKLAGQSAEYLVQQAMDIQTLERTNGYTGMMQPAVRGISEEGFAEIAGYLAMVPREADQDASPAGEALYVQKGCASCHGESAQTPVLPLYPKLAGQNKDYLVNQILQIKNGERSNGSSPAMQALVSTLSEAEIGQIANYLSAL